MDISRRKVFGLMAGAAGGAGLAACATKVKPDGSPLGDYIADNTAEVSFDHGVASGDATADRVIVWTRITPVTKTDGPIHVALIYSTDPAPVRTYAAGELPTEGREVLFEHVETSKARDFTVKIDLSGLKPDTQYYYAFAVKTPEGVRVSPVGATRTVPASGGTKWSLAVVSCSNLPFGLFNAYEAVAGRDDVDAVIHLGDYIYEYGVDGYGGEVGKTIGRIHNPVTEIVTLDDYRARHAQYKSDPKLQAAHQNVPWYCTWDDHESTNNSYRSGAENHNPENNEGDWTSRKQRAVQAYMEWMPVRDLVAGRAKESIYRSVDFGDLATIFMLESRLTGRSDEIDWGTELFGEEPDDIPAKALATYEKVKDPARTMLGKLQEDWLDKGLKTSVESGISWQLLANQVILAKALSPDFAEILPQEELDKMPDGYGQLLGLLARLGLPFNLDAWDGFPAARERLFTSAKSSGARLVTITGDTHTAWANIPHAEDGTQMGVEFGCTSITSPGLGNYLPFEELGKYVADANADVTWYDPFGHGFTMLTLTPDTARADYYKVSTILEESYTTDKVASFEATINNGVVSELKAV
jgi:alkaline phosphatase D